VDLASARALELAKRYLADSHGGNFDVFDREHCCAGAIAGRFVAFAVIVGRDAAGIAGAAVPGFSWPLTRMSAGAGAGAGRGAAVVGDVGFGGDVGFVGGFGGRSNFFVGGGCGVFGGVVGDFVDICSGDDAEKACDELVFDQFVEVGELIPDGLVEAVAELIDIHDCSFLRGWPAIKISEDSDSEAEELSLIALSVKNK